MFIRYLFLAAICLFTVTCSTSKTTYIDPEYRSKIKETSILVVPLEYYPEIGYRSKSSNRISAVDHAALNNLLGPIFSSVTTADVFGVDTTLSLDGIPFRTRHFQAGELSFSFPVPETNQPIPFQQNIPEFILFLNDYFFENERITSDFNQQTGSAQISYKLSFQTYYVIWDNVHQRTAAHGRIHKVVDYEDKTTDRDHIRLLEKVANAIVEFSPLYSREKAIEEFINNQEEPSSRN